MVSFGCPPGGARETQRAWSAGAAGGQSSPGDHVLTVRQRTVEGASLTACGVKRATSVRGSGRAIVACTRRVGAAGVSGVSSSLSPLGPVRATHSPSVFRARLCTPLL